MGTLLDVALSDPVSLVLAQPWGKCSLGVAQPALPCPKTAVESLKEERTPWSDPLFTWYLDRHITTLPAVPGLPPHQSLRPYMVYEMEQIRQLNRKYKEDGDVGVFLLSLPLLYIFSLNLCIFLAAGGNWAELKG